MSTPNQDLANQVSQQRGNEAVNVYDQRAGRYVDDCGKGLAPTPADRRPRTVNPFGGAR